MPRRHVSLLGSFLLASAAFLHGQQSSAPQISQTDAEKDALLSRVIENQKKNDEAMNFLYERVERKEIRKGSQGSAAEIKVSRVVPAGTGVDHIELNQDGKPADPATYRAQLEKLEHVLSWASEEGSSQREAFEKAEKHQKDREDLIDATHRAFLYTFVSTEPRGDKILLKYHLEPNPAFKATSRITSIFSKVRGYAWIDAEADELARVEVDVMDDISFGGFLAKIYKGSHLMQESYEVAPGIWLPSYSQFDFDGRRFFFSFALHERTFYSQYRRIGPPKEALALIRAELDKPAQSDP